MRARDRGNLSDLVSHNPAVRRLQIKTSLLATDIFAGEYRSAFRGCGIEFNEVREYQPGDDIRSIDWNVTARLGRPFIKRFIEEREIKLILVLDRSPSMEFGTIKSTKLEIATEVCALLAFASLHAHDRVALLTFGNGGLDYLPPGKGKRHTLRLIRGALAPVTNRNGDSGLVGALDHLSRVVKDRAFVFIISDFNDPVPIKLMAAIAGRHDTVAVSVSDPAEHELPAAGILMLSDAESTASFLIDSDSSSVRSEYKRIRAEKWMERKKEILAAGASLLELSTRISPFHPLIQFFRTRKRDRPL